MTAAQLLGLFGVWAIAVVSPGPDVVVVLQRALAGRRHGVATALGIVTGLTVWLGPRSPASPRSPACTRRS